MKIITIIPARIGSQRIPGKPLLKIEGRTMIARTAERVLAAGLKPVVLASDSERILNEASSFQDLTPVLTSPLHKCGTERTLEAYQIMSKKMGEFDLIINVQGDEPFISPEMLRALPAELKKRKDLADCWTTVAELPERDLNDRNVAKVALDMKQNALIFTRDPLSHAYKHTSVYIYTPDFLEKFCALPPIAPGASLLPGTNESAGQRAENQLRSPAPRLHFHQHPGRPGKSWDQGLSTTGAALKTKPRLEKFTSKITSLFIS